MSEESRMGDTPKDAESELRHPECRPVASVTTYGEHPPRPEFIFFGMVSGDTS